LLEAIQLDIEAKKWFWYHLATQFFFSLPQYSANSPDDRYGGVIGQMNTRIGSQNVLVGSAQGYPPNVTAQQLHM
jgi:hypothetical protein